LENRVKNGPDMAVRASIHNPHKTSSTAAMIFTVFMVTPEIALYGSAPEKSKISANESSGHPVNTHRANIIAGIA
jgi:hypothetical protein